MKIPVRKATGLRIVFQIYDSGATEVVICVRQNHRISPDLIPLPFIKAMAHISPVQDISRAN